MSPSVIGRPQWRTPPHEFNIFVHLLGCEWKKRVASLLLVAMPFVTRSFLLIFETRSGRIQEALLELQDLPPDADSMVSLGILAVCFRICLQLYKHSGGSLECRLGRLQGMAYLADENFLAARDCFECGFEELEVRCWWVRVCFQRRHNQGKGCYRHRNTRAQQDSPSERHPLTVNLSFAGLLLSYFSSQHIYICRYT